MPFLIDGNNLMFAMKKVGVNVGRDGLCKLLAMLAQRGERVCVVFDGPPPHGRHGEYIEETAVEVIYSEKQPADEIIEDLIAENSAPRRLTVVSTDHEIRRAARRRRCQGIRSEDFALMLVELREAPPKPKRVEPGEKWKGLGQGQTQEWLREFGIDIPPEDESTPPSPKREP